MPKDAPYAPSKEILKKWLRRDGKRRIRRLERREGKREATG
jgi:hypothetical protein